MATYYVWSGAAGSANGSSWANAYTALQTALSGKSAGDVFYVAHDHAQTSAANVTLTSNGTIANPTKVVCVNRSGSVPPVSADRRTTGRIETTGAFNIIINISTHYDGLVFSGATGSTAGNAIQLAQSASDVAQRFDNCTFVVGHTGATGGMAIGINSQGGIYVEFNNTTVSLGHVGQTLSINAMLQWRNTASALLGTIPTVLFGPASIRGGSVECIGVDFSAAGSGKTLVGLPSTSSQTGYFRFVDCKLNASVTKSTVPTGMGAVEIDFVRCGSSGVNYAIFRHRVSGTLDHETTVVRSGGASDGVTPISWKVTTTTACNYSLPFVCPPIAIWNDTIGSPVTATVECIGAAIGTDKEVWLECEFLGDAGSPQSIFASDAADILATAGNQTSSSETWGGSTAAFKLAVTFTPQQKGWIYARVKCAKASSTFYIDPLITLT